jgi:hypothetical protein
MTQRSLTTVFIAIGGATAAAQAAHLMTSRTRAGPLGRVRYQVVVHARVIAPFFSTPDRAA